MSTPFWESVKELAEMRERCVHCGGSEGEHVGIKCVPMDRGTTYLSKADQEHEHAIEERTAEVIAAYLEPDTRLRDAVVLIRGGYWRKP